MKHHLNLGLCVKGAARARRLSVVTNVASYLLFLYGELPVAALTKIVAEFLRLPYFYYTEAWDMVWLAAFFIIASFVSLLVWLPH